MIALLLTGIIRLVVQPLVVLSLVAVVFLFELRGRRRVPCWCRRRRWRRLVEKVGAGLVEAGVLVVAHQQDGAAAGARGGVLRLAVDLALALGRRRRTEAIPKELRRRAMATAGALRHRGESWRAVASEVGLSAGTVQRWLAAEPKGGFARVVVREPERVLGARREASDGGSARRGDTVVVLPNGVRVEGLAGADLIAVLRALA